MTIKNLIEIFERKLLTSFGTQFLSFNEVDSMIENLANQAREYDPDCIVGILNSGAYVGRKISKILGGDYQEIGISRASPKIFDIPLKDIVAIGKIRAIIKPYPMEISGTFYDKNYKRILFVDEECAGGATFDLGRQLVRSKNLDAQIKEAALHVCPGIHTPDYFFERTIPLNRFIGRTTRFPWATYSPYFKEYVGKLDQLKN